MVALHQPKKKFGLESGPLEYFKDHFTAKPMADAWSPPSIQFAGRSRNPKDFVSWMSAAPVVSERAMRLLGRLPHLEVEFLPIFEHTGQKYFAMNVLRETKKVDLAKSQIRYLDDDCKHIMMIDSVEFDFGGEMSPPAFKISGYSSEVFVSEELVALVRESGLSGAMFLDPRKGVLDRILAGTLVDDSRGCSLLS